MAPSIATEMVRKRRMLRQRTDICGIIDNMNVGNHTPAFDERGDISFSITW